MLAFRAEPIRVQVGLPFMLLMNVCTKRNEPAELVRVDATMPEHRHGMNYRPTLARQGEGRYVADVALPGQAHMVLVRSPHAHARILSIDSSLANTCRQPWIM